MKSLPASALLALALVVTALSFGYITFKSTETSPLTIAPQTQTAQVGSSLPSGLVAYLPFDNSTADSSGSGNNGSWSGSASYGAGKIGSGSASFTGSNYVTINSQVYPLAGGTVAFWFKKNGNGVITGSYGGAQNQRAPTLSISSTGTLRWEFGGATNNDTGIAVDSNWHHFAMSYNNIGGARVYLDGAMVADATTNKPESFLNQVHIGHYGNYGSSFGNGFVDDFRIYNRELSASEISAIRAYVGAPAADTSAPLISGVTVSLIEQNQVTVTWNTNEVSDTYVDFGLTASYGSHSTLKDTGAGMVTSHTQIIAGLQPNTTYNYRVTSKDAAGNSASSANATFTTLAPPNNVPTVSVSSSIASGYAPASATLSATAADSDGSVARVEFYNGSSLLASDTAAPYSYAWSNIAVGTYSVTARAYDNLGASTVSSPVTIAITAVPVVMSTKFKIGDKVQVTETSANVRTSGALNASLLGTQPMYSVATVTGGGAQNSTDKFFWWNLDFQTGVDGYMGEGSLALATISSAYKIGDRVQTKNATNVRSAPTISTATLLGSQPTNAVGTIVKGGMLNSDGTFSWWYINYDSGVDGYSGEDNLKLAGTNPASDTTAPSIPSGLTATAASASQINLAWSAATDNTAVTGYRIYRNGAQVATAPGTSYSDTGLTAATAYSYTVSAYDAAGNSSAQSAAASATTLSVTPTSYSVTVTKSGTGTGTVTSTGSINCGTTCTANGTPGQTVTLTATPATGSTFTGWTGSCTGTSTTCSFTLNANSTVNAAFTLNVVTPPGTSLYITPGGAGAKNGADWNNACAGFTGVCSGSSLVAGSTYYLGAGTYPAVTISSSGTVAAPITIVRPTSQGNVTIGVPTIISGDNVILDGGSWHGITFVANRVSTTPGLTSTQGASVILAGSNNVLRNTFLNGTYGAGQGHSLGISLPGTGTTRVEYNDLYQSAYEDQMTIVPRATGGDIIFDHNVFRDNNKPNRSDTAHRDVVNTWTGSGGYGLVISNNIFFNTPDHASDQPQGDEFLLQDAYGGSAAPLKKVEAFNNVVYGTARFIAFGSLNSGTNSFRVYNNTVRNAINGDEVGITAASPAPSPTKSNNLGNTTANPGFVNATNPLGADGIPFTADDGFNLTSASSGAIDKATGTLVSVNDIRGNVRTGVADLGAYEYTGTVTTPTSYTVGVTKSGAGSGTVTSAGSINCGTTCSSVGDPGMTVTLTATPATGSIFSSWSGISGCSTSTVCSFILNANTIVNAIFNLIPASTYSLSLSTSGSGSVSKTVDGVLSSATSFAPGTQVILTATPATGYAFSGWAGGCSGSLMNCTVTMNANTSVTASFSPITAGGGNNWYLNASVGTSGNGSSWASAWKNTSNISWSSIQPGDTLWVAGGSYGSLAIAKSGTAAKLIYIKRVLSSDSVATGAGWSTSLDSRATFGPLSAPVSYIEVDGRVDMGMRFISANGSGTPSSFDATNGHYVTVDHVDLVGPSAANSLEGASIGSALATFNGDNSGVNIGYGYPSHSTNNITVRNSRVRGHPNEFWFANANNITIENNKIYDNGAANSATWHGNMMIVNGSNGIIFRNNEVFNWQVEGLYPWGSTSRNWYVYGNVFHDGYGGKSGSTHRFLELRSYSGTVTHGPFYVYNNTITNAYAAFTRGDTTVYWSSDSIAKNNLVYNVGGGMGYLPANASNNVTASTNPFVSSTNFKLAAPLAGVSVPNVTTVIGPVTNFEKDPSGATRGADGVWDVGAYEY